MVPVPESVCTFGLAAIEKSGTTTLKTVVCISELEVPVTVTCYVPARAVEGTLIVSVDDAELPPCGVTEVGLSEALHPDG